MVYCLHMSDNCKCSSYIYVDVWKTVWNDSLPLSHTFRDNEFCGRWSQMKTGFHALVRKGATVRVRRSGELFRLRNRPIHARGACGSLAPKNEPSVCMKRSAALRDPLPVTTWRRCSRSIPSSFLCCCICRSRALDYERLFQALGRPPSLAYLIVFSSQKLAAKMLQPTLG